MADKKLSETGPVEKNQSKYAELMKVYRGLYPALRETFSRLAQFNIT